MVPAPGQQPVVVNDQKDVQQKEVSSSDSRSCRHNGSGPAAKLPGSRAVFFLSQPIGARQDGGNHIFPNAQVCCKIPSVGGLLGLGSRISVKLGVVDTFSLL